MKDELRTRVERAIAKEAANKHVFAVGRGGPRYERVDEKQVRMLAAQAEFGWAWNGGPDKPRAA